MTTNRAPSTAATLSRSMTEDELLTAITEAATYRGWRWMHLGNDQRGVYRGHTGFPDLCLARGGRVLFLELKRDGQKPRADQLAWLNEIGPCGCGDLNSRIVYPQNLDDILKALE